MKYCDILWIEDEANFQDGILYYLKGIRDEIKVSVIPWLYESMDGFDKNSHFELSSLPMSVILIDYNLPNGVNGDEIIKKIRSFPANSKIPIIFYSASKNITELETLTKKFVGITYSQKKTLQSDLQTFLSSL